MNFGLRSAVCGPGFDICCKVTPNSPARDRLVWRSRARPMAASQRVEDQYSKEGPFENPTDLARQEPRFYWLSCASRDV
jgi:hypothetical protein